MDDLHRKKKILETWIDNFNQTQDFAPSIAQSLEITEKQIEIVDKIPNGNDEIKTDLINLFSSDLYYLESVVPDFIIKQSFNDSSINAIGVSGSTSGYSYIQNIIYSESQLDSWKSSSLKEFDDIQGKQKRFDQIISIIKKIDPKTSEEFENTKIQHQRFKQDLISAEIMGLALRNTMDHLKGELFDKTTKLYHQVNGKPFIGKCNWSTFAEYAAKNGKNSDEYNELINVIAVYPGLYDFLSSLLKGREKFTKEYVMEQIVKCIDVLFSILNLIDIEKLVLVH